jgi:hypothetical protein
VQYASDGIPSCSTLRFSDFVQIFGVVYNRTPSSLSSFGGKKKKKKKKTKVLLFLTWTSPGITGHAWAITLQQRNGRP